MLEKINQKLAFLFFVIPMAVAMIYYAFIAADRYVSESIITVRQSGDSGTAAVTGFAMLLAGVNTGSREENLYLREYIHSLDMLKHLEAKIGLRKAYESEHMDLFFRLAKNASQESFEKYFKNRVEVHFDDISGLLTVRVEGFDPEFTRSVNTEILAQCERFVNEISHRMAREQMTFAEGELRRASDRLRDAKARLLVFQNKHGVFDPLSQAQAAATLTGQIEAEIARKETELKAMLGYMQENAPAVVSLRNEVAALYAQMHSEQQKLASDKGGRLNKLAAEFHGLTLEAGFAEEAYKVALAAVETARIEASRKVKSVVVIESPSKPEIALYPRRIYNLMTLAAVLLMIYGISRLTIATIQDHRD